MTLRASERRKSDRKRPKLNDQTRVLVGPAIPQSEVLAKFLKEICEQCGEILAKFFADFILQFPGKMAAINFTKNPRHFRTARNQVFFFFSLQLWGLGV